ncbi:kappaPI-actitoxin-Avd3b-like [Spodoptera litura]|uniref:KappaPI-actitoxin-Avd3b-like n=1 Tax=Spodoptera litura TaxID=69820 RepID=A0A9J7DU45_SPOLT|nr:kappaPI-actitoxin-Avd3b-like [Spodoptera litura]
MYKLLNIILIFLFIVADCSAELDPKCLLPSDPGLCLALVPMYTYNSAMKICEPFAYGGCQGNENRFASLEKCQAACH